MNGTGFIKVTAKLFIFLDKMLNRLIQRWQCHHSGWAFIDPTHGSGPWYFRDGIYGQWLPDLLKEFDSKSVKTRPRSPWENPFIERFFGSLKREMLDRIDVIDNGHARELSLDYQLYYNHDRPHQGIDGSIPGLLDGKQNKIPDFENLKVRKIRKLNGLVTQFALAA